MLLPLSPQSKHQLVIFLILTQKTKHPLKQTNEQTNQQTNRQKLIPPIFKVLAHYDGGFYLMSHSKDLSKDPNE